MSAILHQSETIVPSDTPLSPFQVKCLSAIDEYPYVGPPLGWIAHKVGSNQLAVYSSMAALERRGIVHSYRSGQDQWAVICVWGTARKIYPKQ